MVSLEEVRPLACWTGTDYYQGENIPSLTIILKTRGCNWNRCLMCGYRFERYSADELLDFEAKLNAQLNWVINNYPSSSYSMVKIYSSGSLFDPKEVPSSFLSRIASAFRGKVVVVETRPEFIEENKLETFISDIDTGAWETPLYCAIGLETTNDNIRDKCIDKGFSMSDFFCAAEEARKAGAGVKAYVLLKPPYLTENESIEDSANTIREVAKIAELISLNPCTVQKNTNVEFLWKRGGYRPPYLWSVLEVISRADIFVTCDPVGAGKVRGPHNCGKCDTSIIDGIRDYNLNGDLSLIEALLEIECDCKDEWEFICMKERSYCMPLTH